MEYGNTLSPLCPSGRGYPLVCPRPFDDPDHTVCCRDQGTPSCCHARAHTICAARGHGVHRVEGEFKYDPGQNWTTKWCPDSDRSIGCCFSHNRVECCELRLGYTQFWWGTMVIGLGLFLYFCLKRRNNGCGKLQQPEPQIIAMQELPSNQTWPRPIGDRDMLITNNNPAWLNQGGEDTLFDQSQLGRAPAAPIAPPAYEENNHSGPPPGPQPPIEPNEAPPSYESVVGQNHQPNNRITNAP